MDKKILDAIDYFDVSEDVSQITWAHAVNGMDHLMDSLDDPNIMMCEADVSYGNLLDENFIKEKLPIMAHLPTTTSDLCLETFLDQFITAFSKKNKKGIKLDFKDVDSFKEGFKILQDKLNSIFFPLWLNADILQSPHSPEPLINADEFLSLATHFFPKATISIGWSTKQELNHNFSYTFEMVREVLDVIERNDLHQPVNFPIRAAYVGRSLDPLVFLLDSILDSSLTLWNSCGDPVDALSLVLLQEAAGEDKVYLDLPEADIKQFNMIREARRYPSPIIKVFPQKTPLYLTIFLAVLSILISLYFSL